MHNLMKTVDTEALKLLLCLSGEGECSGAGVLGRVYGVLPAPPLTEFGLGHVALCPAPLPLWTGMVDFHGHREAHVHES